MTTSHDIPESQPADAVMAHVAAFNSGDSQVLQQAYEDAAVLVPHPGQPMTGAERDAASGHLLSMGLPIVATVRHVYQADDIALLIVDWSIDGVAPDGTEVHLAGAATDVARRGADGRWRYLIDNPFGTAAMPPS